MRLKTSIALANEALVSLVNSGYAVRASIKQDYLARKQVQTFDDNKDVQQYEKSANQWLNQVDLQLKEIFPTELEINTFLHPEIPLGAVSGDYKYQSLMRRFEYFIKGLDKIRLSALTQYTDLPIQDRLYIEDIDSFRKARDVNPAMIKDFLSNGFLNCSEEQVKLSLERILDVPGHRKDWGGEINDLYTANVIVGGMRRATAFLLKGPGIGKKEMTIADCGKNGDQIVRLFITPADLFVIQYIGPIADAVIKDVKGKVAELRSRNLTAHFLIIDGQDTARLMHAYGDL